MAVAVGEHAIVADLDEAFGQDVQLQAADELLAGEGHGLSPGIVRVVLVGEGDGAGGPVQGENAVIGDADPVGVAGEIGQDDLWAFCCP